MGETIVAKSLPCQNVPVSDFKNTLSKLDDMSSLSSYNPEDKEFYVCGEHGEKESRFEAYCEETKKLLCINCILEE
jgi:hypothetical protein